MAEAGRVGAGEFRGRRDGGVGDAELVGGREGVDVLEWLGERRDGGEGERGGTGGGRARDIGRCGRCEVLVDSSEEERFVEAET